MCWFPPIQNADPPFGRSQARQVDRRENYSQAYPHLWISSFYLAGDADLAAQSARLSTFPVRTLLMATRFGSKTNADWTRWQAIVRALTIENDHTVVFFGSEFPATEKLINSFGDSDKRAKYFSAMRLDRKGNFARVRSRAAYAKSHLETAISHDGSGSHRKRSRFCGAWRV